MKLSQLLAHRSQWLRQVRLAELAYVYHNLRGFADRAARARLRGHVVLRPIAPAEERYCVTLTALEGSQAVIEEHFSDEDLLRLADAIGCATGHPDCEHTFRIDELSEFAAALRADLVHAGVTLDDGAATVTEPPSEA